MNNHPTPLSLMLLRLNKLADSLGLLGICVVLAIAFYYQLVLFELPCPLCLLQRAGIMLIGIGFLLNIRFGIHSAHYAIGLLGAILTGAIALRQIFLHIMPGDNGYGSPIFGLHFYTWAAILALLSLIMIALLMFLKSWEYQPEITPQNNVGEKLIIAFFTLLVVANLVSTILECGAGQCDDNPTYYQLLHKLMPTTQ